MIVHVTLQTIAAECAEALLLVTAVMVEPMAAAMTAATAAATAEEEAQRKAAFEMNAELAGAKAYQRALDADVHTPVIERAPCL